MFRLIKSINVLKISTQCINDYCTYNPAFLPLKKSHRKPRWIPIAKSKRFRVPERPNIPEDEAKEILRLHNNYRNNIKSIRRYLTKKHCTIYQASLDPEEILKHFKEDFKKCTEVNDKWNAEVRFKREKRLAEELEGELAFARNRIEQELVKQDQINQLAEEIVRKEKEASVSFITPENIDAVIDKALSEIVDYNYAIDMNGEKLLGRESKPVQEKDKIIVRQKYSLQKIKKM